MATYNLAFPDVAIDAILTTAYHLQQAGYIFRGSASDYSGTPTQREWVIAPAGFTGFGITSPVPKGSIGICLYNGTAWVGKVINVVTIDANPGAGSDNAVSSGGTFLALATISQNIIGAVTSLSLSDGTTSADQATKLTLKLSNTYDSVTSLLSSLDLVAATSTKAGLMSAADKAKVDAFLDNLRSLSFADTTPGADVGTKIVETLKMTVGGVQEAVTALTILAATTSKAGLMSATDKAYIDGLPLSLTSINADIIKLLAMLGYYECSTAAATAAKEVSASGYVLTNGGCIRIKMTNANTAANVTLNINSTGAKALYYDGAQASSTNTWEAGEVLEVYYDGTQYQCASGGGGKFATGEKLKDVGITHTIDNSDDLVTSNAVSSAIDSLQGTIPTNRIGVGKYQASNKNAGLGCVFDYLTPKKMYLDSVILAASYSGTAYFVIADIANSVCTVESVIQVPLSGLSTDLSGLKIEIPAGKAVGLFGVTNSHSVTGAGFFKTSGYPNVGDVITGTNNVGDFTIVLSDVMTEDEMVEDISDSIKMSATITVGNLTGTTNATSDAYVENVTYDKDYMVTGVTLPVALTGYIVIVIGKVTNNSFVVDNTYPVYINNQSNVDLSSYKINLPSGSCIGLSNPSGKLLNRTGGGFYGKAQTGQTLGVSTWYPSVNWTLSENIGANQAILEMRNEIDEMKDDLLIETAAQRIGIASGGNGYNGYTGIFKTKLEEDKLLKTITLETAFTGTGIVIVATPAQDNMSCTVTAVYPVSLDGKVNDVSGYNITVPSGSCIGLGGVSNSQLYQNSNSWFSSSTPSVGTVVGSNNYAINASFDLVKITKVGDAMDEVVAEVVAMDNEIEKLKNPAAITNSLLYDEDFTDSDMSQWKESTSSIISLSSSGLTFAKSGDANYIQLARMYALNGREMTIRATLYSDTVLKFGQKLYNASGVTYNCTVNCAAGTITIGTSTTNFSFVNGEDYIIKWIANLTSSKLYVQSAKSGLFATAETSRNAYLDTYVFSLNTGTSPVIKSIRITSCVPNPYVLFMGDSITQGTGVTQFDKMYGNLIGARLNKPYGVSGRGQGTIYSIVGESGFVGRLDTEVKMLRPKYLVVMIGTNSGNTAGNLSELCEKCAAYGVTLILNNIPCNNAGTTTANDLITEIREYFGLEGMRMDLATSLNNNGATANSALYADQNLHPNDDGHYQMYLRSFIDTPDIYINAGIEPIALPPDQ